MSLILTLFITTYLSRENARRDVLLREQNLTLENFSDDMKSAQRAKGDGASFFRYTV
jgi:hypothetical protein